MYTFVPLSLLVIFASLLPISSWAANTNGLFDNVEVTMCEASEVKSFLFENGVRLNFRHLDEMENDACLMVTLAGGEIEETHETHCFTEAACNSYQFSTSKHSLKDLLDDVKEGPISLGLERKSDHLRIAASCMGEDLESLFKLLHAVLSDPSIDAKDFDEWKYKKVKKYEQSEQKLIPFLRKTQVDLLCEPAEVRLRDPENSAQIAKIDYEGINRWLQRIFTNAPLEVNLVGDVDMTKVVMLAKRYIGSLPPREVLSEKTLQDKRLLAIKAGPYHAKVKCYGKTDLNAVYTGYVTARKMSKETELLLRLFVHKLTKKVGSSDGTRPNYNIEAFFVTNDAFKNYGFFGAEILCDPDMGEHFAAAADQVMQELANTGPTEKELRKVTKERMKTARRNLDDPYFWLDQMADAFYRNDDQNIVHTGKMPDYESVSVDDLKVCMQEIVRPENHTSVILESGF